MICCHDAMSGLGAVLLPVVAGLLFEELTFGGLVRLLLAPRPGTRKTGRAGSGNRLRRADVQELKPARDGRREMIALKMLLNGRGSAVAGCRVCDSAIWHFGCAFARAPQGLLKENDGCRTVNRTRRDCLARPAGAGAGGLPAAADGRSIVVVPSGMGGVRVSQIGGTLPGTLYPGVHFITPLVDSVRDLRPARSPVHGRCRARKARSPAAQKTGLDVQSREGLNIGLAVTVRYRLDPNKLDSVQAHMPQPADKELVPPVVASAWRELAPQYTVREIFSTKREEVRSKAAAIITRKLGRRRHRRGRGDALRHSIARRSTPRAWKVCCSKSRKTTRWA